MVNGGLPMSPFQSMSFSPADTNELHALAKTIVEANLDQYQTFADVEINRVDLTKWKLLKSKDKLDAYLERRTRPPAHNNSSIDNLHAFLCIGTTPGSLNDVMLQAASGGGRSCELGRGVVLSTLTTPTIIDPFQSATVKWTELDARMRTVGLVKRHDYVYVESTGTKQLPSGERVGYHLLHSIELSETPVLSERVRGLLSVCSFFRQVDDTSVSVYTMGMMAAMCDRARRVILPHFVKTLLSTLRKKAGGGKARSLTQAIGKRYSELKSLGSSSPDSTCVMCSKRAWQLGNLSSHQSTCNVCSGYVCSACKVVKKLDFMTPELKMTRRKVIFCPPCEADEDVSEFSFAEKSRSNKLRRNSFWRSRSGSRTLDVESSSMSPDLTRAI